MLESIRVLATIESDFPLTIFYSKGTCQFDLFQYPEENDLTSLSTFGVNNASLFNQFSLRRDALDPADWHDRYNRPVLG